MKHRTSIKWARSPALAALLLVGFLARALIPAGFMPGAGGLIQCSGYAPAPGALGLSMTHDMSSMNMSGMDMSAMDHQGKHTSHDGRSPGHDGSSPCPFAAAASTLAPGHSAVPTDSMAVEPGAVPLPNPSFVPRGTTVPTRLPRGPPPTLA